MNKLILITAIIGVVMAGAMLTFSNDDSDGATGSYTDGDWTFNVSGSNATIVSNTATGITALNIPSTVTANGTTYNVTSIGVGGSSTSSKIVDNSQLSNGCTLTIPNGIININNFAFAGCSGFTGSLTIPDSVTSISLRAFTGCSGFTGSLTIPDSVTSIGDYAFNNCSGFTGSLIIPDGVTSIGKSAFYGCSGFTGSLIIPDSVTSIGINAFYGCSGFTGTLTLSNNLSTIDFETFYLCRGFTGSLIIPDSVTSIGNEAFTNCSGFTGSLIIPDSVTSIGQIAFSGCSGITGLVVPDSVTSIGNEAFRMNGVKEVLNLGTISLNPGSYGLPADCVVRSDIDASAYIAPASITESQPRTGAVYDVVALIPLIIVFGILLTALGYFVINRYY